jgi:hypothetical protein
VASSVAHDQRLHVADSFQEPIDSFPRFREAKKAWMQIDFSRTRDINLAPGLSEREFHLSPEFTHSLLFAEEPAVRGPPVLL